MGAPPGSPIRQLGDLGLGDSKSCGRLTSASMAPISPQGDPRKNREKGRRADHLPCTSNHFFTLL